MKQVKGLDMLEHEKLKMRELFNESKHLSVVDMNICLYLNRYGILNLDAQPGGGKKFVRRETRVDNARNNVIPDVYETLNCRDV